MRKGKRLPGQLLGVDGFRTEYIDGRWWTHCYHPEHTDNPLRFVASKGDRVLTPPNGFTHDFASIPRFVWRLLGPPTGFGPGANYGPAGILHDWAYENQHWDSGEPITRQQADAILWEACFDLNVDEWRREVMYAAVRIGGAVHFKGHRDWKDKGRKPDYTVEV